VALNLRPVEAEVLETLLKEVVEDERFTLNEMETQVVGELIEALESGPHTLTT
jgi:hypothetical protein